MPGELVLDYALGEHHCCISLGSREIFRKNGQKQVFMMGTANFHFWLDFQNPRQEGLPYAIMFD